MYVLVGCLFKILYVVKGGDSLPAKKGVFMNGVWMAVHERCRSWTVILCPFMNGHFMPIHERPEKPCWTTGPVHERPKKHLWTTVLIGTFTYGTHLCSWTPNLWQFMNDLQNFVPDLDEPFMNRQKSPIHERVESWHSWTCMKASFMNA